MYQQLLNTKISSMIRKQIHNYNIKISKMFTFIDFNTKSKTKPGRWGNVGDFINDDKKKYKIQKWNSVMTTQDHCGDIICGKKESIIKAQNTIS